MAVPGPRRPRSDRLYPVRVLVFWAVLVLIVGLGAGCRFLPQGPTSPPETGSPRPVPTANPLPPGYLGRALTPVSTPTLPPPPPTPTPVPRVDAAYIQRDLERFADAPIEDFGQVAPTVAALWEEVLGEPYPQNLITVRLYPGQDFNLIRGRPDVAGFAVPGPGGSTVINAPVITGPISLEILFHEIGHARHNIENYRARRSGLGLGQARELNEAVAETFATLMWRHLTERYTLPLPYYERRPAAFDPAAAARETVHAYQQYWEAYGEEHAGGFFVAWLTALKDPELNFGEKLRQGQYLSAAEVRRLNDRLIGLTGRYRLERSISEADLSAIQAILRSRLQQPARAAGGYLYFPPNYSYP